MDFAVLGEKDSAMTNTQNRYAPEFRRQMVELVRAGPKPAEQAKEFGPTPWSIALLPIPVTPPLARSPLLFVRQRAQVIQQLFQSKLTRPRKASHQSP